MYVFQDKTLMTKKNSQTHNHDGCEYSVQPEKKIMRVK